VILVLVIVGSLAGLLLLAGCGSSQRTATHRPLDAGLRLAAERALAVGLKEGQTRGLMRGGSCIAMDPSTGAVISLKCRIRR